MSVEVPALAVRGLVVRYGRTPVLHGIDLEVGTGRTLGLVGESGSGKSTLGRAVVGALQPHAGVVELHGKPVGQGPRSQRVQQLRQVQLIPQDPYASLNPRSTIGEALAEALDPTHADLRRHQDEVARWLEIVGLPASAMHRHPHAFSGGERQRIAIARGLAVRPSIVVADEITSALDVSVQADILALVARLRVELGLTMLFISHNLAVVRQVSDDVAVLRHGHVVEHGPVAQVYDDPQHAYTRELLDAVPGSPGFLADPPRSTPTAVHLPTAERAAR